MGGDAGLEKAEGPQLVYEKRWETDNRRKKASDIQMAEEWGVLRGLDRYKIALRRTGALGKDMNVQRNFSKMCVI